MIVLRLRRDNDLAKRRIRKSCYDKEAKQYFDITPNIDDEMTHKYVVDTELMNYEVSDDELSVIH